MKLLVIEDDMAVASYIAKGMREVGYVVDVSNNGKDGLFMATTENYDLMIVDRMLPVIDGLTIIKTLRGSGSHTPVIILSAIGDVDDRVEGLRAGSDDYVVKPFSFTELLARVEVLIRRQSSYKADLKTDTLIGSEDLELNLLSRKVTRQGKKIDLQPREFALLEYMLRNKGKVVTRTMLLEHVWDYHFDPQTNVIDVHVSRLRSKVDKDFDTPVIKTVRGAGYIIEN